VLTKPEKTGLHTPVLAAVAVDTDDGAITTYVLSDLVVEFNDSYISLCSYFIFILSQLVGF